MTRPDPQDGFDSLTEEMYLYKQGLWRCDNCLSINEIGMGCECEDDNEH